MKKSNHFDKDTENLRTCNNCNEIKPCLNQCENHKNQCENHKNQCEKQTLNKNSREMTNYEKLKYSKEYFKNIHEQYCFICGGKETDGLCKGCVYLRNS